MPIGPCSYCREFRGAELHRRGHRRVDPSSQSNVIRLIDALAVQKSLDGISRVQWSDLSIEEAEGWARSSVRSSARNLR